jgi:protein-tyrosine-phosphatase
MADRPYNVLFLCTGNTARSIIAESILREDGAGRFNAFSAGSHPKGVVNPFALKVLAAAEYPTEGFSSKAWDVFAVPGAPVMDFVFTVCDDAAGDLARAFGTPHNTMSTHLAVLSRARLVTARRESRSMLYSADLDGFRALVAFLTRDCCCGRPEICAPILDTLSSDLQPGA